MQLARATTNILHCLIDDSHNISWNPTGSLLDCAFFETNFRYYLRPMQNPNFKNPSSRTAITLQEPYHSDQKYGLVVTGNINDNSAQEAMSRHVNRVLVLNMPRSNIKKEDWMILAQRSNDVLKVYTSQGIADTWGMSNNSEVVNFGVPLDILTDEDITQSEDVLIHDTSMLGRQLAGQFQQAGLTCNLTPHFHTFEDFSNQVKKHKVFITTTLNGNYEALCAVACGASVIGSNSVVEKSPGITIQNNGAQMLETVQSLLSTKQDIAANRKYLEENYNFGTFQTRITEIFNKKIREAYIA